VSRSSDVDARVSRLMDQLMNPSLSPEQVDGINNRITLLKELA
jgi:hypothetical protein